MEASWITPRTTLQSEVLTECSHYHILHYISSAYLAAFVAPILKTTVWGEISKYSFVLIIKALQIKISAIGRIFLWSVFSIFPSASVEIFDKVTRKSCSFIWHYSSHLFSYITHGTVHIRLHAFTPPALHSRPLCPAVCSYIIAIKTRASLQPHLNDLIPQRYTVDFFQRTSFFLFFS